ncbi:MAG: peptidoglycan DD-metalloendopeptidase family protein [Candidatus Peribacteraceae bacterium]|nr:peptidoglycan DD-metalloendopeptidase family protein [Candidatus Peribacteraceae bacterium]
MSALHSSPHSWLSVRLRLLCGVVFIVSLFLPAYVSDTVLTTPPDVQADSRGFFLAEEGFLTKTSSLSEQGMRSAYTQGIVHTVEAGESLGSIAKQASLKQETIAWVNGLAVNASLKPGQKLLLLPVDGVLHTVKRGQNLPSIAELYGVSAEAIARQNNVKSGYLLANQELIIPGGKPIVVEPTKPTKPVGETLQPIGKQPGAFPQLKNLQEKIVTTYGILQLPCNCFYTQYYGSYHYGVDLQERGGGPVYAAEAGTVIRAQNGWNGGYGNVIEIDHGNGMITLYAHNKELYVKVGDRAARGQVIAFMGNTGRVHGPTGIHVHFEVQVNGVKKNPTMYLQQ